MTESPPLAPKSPPGIKKVMIRVDDDILDVLFMEKLSRSESYNSVLRRLLVATQNRVKRFI